MADKKDKGWELVQIKAFTSWLNSLLMKRNMEVKNVKTELDDGVKLINFLELLSGQTCKQKYDKKPPSRIQKIQNLSIALSFLEKKLEISASRIGIQAEDFADHNLKLILGFLWTLFKKFKIQTIKHEDKSSEEGLLAWVKEKTEGYEGVNIESFRHSFKSGLAFLALTDAFIQDSNVIDYMSFDKSNSQATLNKAFELAEGQMGVPKLLQADEVSEGEVDERSLIIYISLYFHAFIAKEQQKGLEEDKARMEERMRGLQGSLQSRAEMAEKLSEENAQLKQELAEFKEKDHYLEEKIEILQQLLEQEKEEKQELLKNITEVTIRLNDESSAKNALMEKYQKLEKTLEELTNKYNQEVSERKRENAEREARAKTEIQGLGVLKKNLEEHVEDLHRWQRYLDFEPTAEVDFNGEIRPHIMSDIAQSDFDEQLTYLAKKLEKENEELLGYLKIKEREKTEKKESEQKKKDRKKTLDL
jgi:cortexillin 1/2